MKEAESGYEKDGLTPDERKEKQDKLLDSKMSNNYWLEKVSLINRAPLPRHVHARFDSMLKAPQPGFTITRGGSGGTMMTTLCILVIIREVGSALARKHGRRTGRLDHGLDTI